MSNTSPLAQYLEERRALLQTITALLKNDPRVSAAWLGGSLGRGQDDALSDLDVFVVVSDDHIREVVDQRREGAARAGPPVLYLEAPQNAPVGGGYLMMHYDAPTAPHQVDWSWLPRSLAAIPDPAVVLFDRAGLPAGSQPQVIGSAGASEEITSQPIHFISFFWAMLMITAKYAYRSPWAEEMELLPYVVAELRKTRAYLDLDPEVEVPHHRDPAAKLRVLRSLESEMEVLMPEVAARGAPVPSAIVPGAHRFLALVELGLAR